MEPQRFKRTDTTVLDAAGTGYATVTCPSGMFWDVQLVSVSTSATVVIGTPQSFCELFMDSEPNPGEFLESTFFGDGDTSDSKYRLLGGESLTAQWTDGTPNATATLKLQGMQVQY